MSSIHIKVRVAANTKKEKVIEKSPDKFIVSVREPAEQGLANERILEIFRQKYPGKSVRIESGHHSPSKILTIL